MKPILKSIYPYLFLFFCFLLPLDKYAAAVPNIVLIAMLAAFPFVVKKSDFKKLLRVELYLFAGLLIYVTLNSIVFQEVARDMVIIKKIASAILLVVLYIPLEKTENLKKTIIISVLVCILISLYNMYWFYLQEGAFNFSAGLAIKDVLIIDRLYLGFLCVISIISSMVLIGKKYSEYNTWYFANIVFCVGFVLLISARIAIILLPVLFFLKIFYTKNKRQYLFFFLGIAAIIISTFALNKNLMERFFYTQTEDKTQNYIELFARWEPRVVIWECNYRIAEDENFLMKGLGFYHTKDLLVACFKEVVEREKKRDFFIKSRYNSHNQFVDFLLSTGIIGVLLFLGIFIALTRKRWRDFFSTGLVISLFFFAIIENFFHRQLGAYYFGIIIIFLLMETKNFENKFIKK